MNRKELLEQIADVRTWEKSEEKRMALKGLGKMLLRITYDTQFKEGIYLDMDTYSKPTTIDGILHVIGFHQFLEYQERGKFDCARRICLICGYTDATPLKRRYNAYESTISSFTLEELKLFLGID